MSGNMKVTLMLLAALGAAEAFNPIHEASYSLEPRGNFASGTTLSIGAIIDSRSTDVWAVPASIALKASSRVELGAGIKTVWGEVGDHVPYLVFGVKWQTHRTTGFQADLLIPANTGNGKGFSLASHHRFHYGSVFSSRLAARLGFMEALVAEDALMAFEIGFYPALEVARPLSLELGLIGSSQTEEFEGNLAMDIEPALQVAFARDSFLRAGVALGLAGDRKEEMRAKIVLIHGF
jgi:hypothetical protein